MRLMLTGFAAILAPSISMASDVSLVSRKAWSTAGQSGYTVTYKFEGKTWKNAKVYCVSMGKPIYLLENLDRGDGNKVGMGVEGPSGGLAKKSEIAPGYMDWAVDLWRLSCK